jgi:CRP/FNR family transcriptional regulator, anaerobic regulatory protein
MGAAAGSTVMAMRPNPTAQCQECPTRQLCLAAGLEHAALDRLAACMKPSAPMARGDHLYRAGDPAGGCFVVRSGAYKTFAISAAGEEHVTGFFFPGELLGMAGQASGAHRESATALMTSTACRVQLDDIPTLWSIGSGPSLLRLMGQTERLRSDDHINLSQSRADARVAGFLVALSKRMQHQGRDPLRLPTPMSRTDLANYLGITLECLSRVLARLSQAGLISASRTDITVRAPTELEALTSHLDA